MCIQLRIAINESGMTGSDSCGKPDWMKLAEWYAGESFLPGNYIFGVLETTQTKGLQREEKAFGEALLVVKYII